MSTMAFRPTPVTAWPAIAHGPSLRPAPGMIEPPPVIARLPVHTRPPAPPGPGTRPPRWWWVGCHGGAGCSTLARLIPGGWEAGRAWPRPELGGPPGVLLVCRSHQHGLAAAAAAIRQWAAGLVSPAVSIWGLIIVADAPGRIPKPLAVWRSRLTGTVPATVLVPWVDRWRVQPPTQDTAPNEIAQLGRILQSPAWTARKESP